MWDLLREEMMEILWLASLMGTLSAAGMVVAVALVSG
jgi:hypothetical protein